jgi:hypothetical protein
MRLPSTSFLVLAMLAGPSFARAQTDAPAPLPALPATPPPSAEPGPAGPASLSAPPTPPPPPPVQSEARPTSASAGEPIAISFRRYRHEGFYLAVNGGLAFVSARGNGPLGSASIAGLGSVGDLSIGGTVAPGLVLGGVARDWSTRGTFKGGPVITATTTTYVNGAPTTNHPTLSGHAQAQNVELGAFLDWYPNPEKGWHVGGSVGLGGIAVTDDAGERSTAGGVAGSVFGGYQWWVGPSWSIGMAGVVSVAGASHLDDSDQNDTGYKLTPFGVGLETEVLYY